MNKLLCIHEDTQSNEHVGGGRGGQAAQVRWDEEGGRDRHQARGHQINGGVFFSWVVKVDNFLNIRYNLLLLPAALKASFARAMEDSQSRMGTPKAGIKSGLWF